jgi:hypothetical protein
VGFGTVFLRGRVIPCARFNWKDGFYQAEGQGKQR